MSYPSRNFVPRRLFLFERMLLATRSTRNIATVVNTAAIPRIDLPTPQATPIAADNQIAAAIVNPWKILS
jgi:hypothetical protein